MSAGFRGVIVDGGVDDVDFVDGRKVILASTGSTTSTNCYLFRPISPSPTSALRIQMA